MPKSKPEWYHTFDVFLAGVRQYQNPPCYPREYRRFHPACGGLGESEIRVEGRPRWGDPPWYNAGEAADGLLQLGVLRYVPADEAGPYVWGHPGVRIGGAPLSTADRLDDERIQERAIQVNPDHARQLASGVLDHARRHTTKAPQGDVLSRNTAMSFVRPLVELLFESRVCDYQLDGDARCGAGGILDTLGWPLCGEPRQEFEQACDRVIYGEARDGEIVNPMVQAGNPVHRLPDDGVRAAISHATEDPRAFAELLTSLKLIAGGRSGGKHERVKEAGDIEPAPIADPAVVADSSAVEVAADSGGISQWSPPSGYVGTKTIQNSPHYKKGGKSPAGSTIARWRNRSKKNGRPVIVVAAPELDRTARQKGDSAIIAIRAPDTGEVYFPAQWISDAIAGWTPRSTKCES